MKKAILSLVVVAATSFSAMAQKPTAILEYFSYASSVGEAVCEQVRNSVMSSINDVNRLVLKDASAESSLQLEADRRTSESALGSSDRLAQMVSTGNEYIIGGHVAGCTVTSSKSSDGSISYSATLSYSLKVIKAADGTVMASKDFSYDGFKSGIGGTEKDAIAAVLKNTRTSMEQFINENFKLKATVVASDYETKKDEMTVCYVTLGTSSGIEKGQMLDVATIRMIAGRETEKVIGSLKVAEVVAEDLAKCKVEKGGEEILKAMKEYESMLSDDPDNARELRVITRAKKGLGKFGGMLKDNLL